MSFGNFSNFSQLRAHCLNYNIKEKLCVLLLYCYYYIIVCKLLLYSTKIHKIPQIRQQLLGVKVTMHVEYNLGMSQYKGC